MKGYPEPALPDFAAASATPTDEKRLPLIHSFAMGVAIFNAAPLAIAAMDLDRRVVGWNPAAERLFGWPREEILGRPYPLVPEAYREEFEGHWRDTLGGNAIVGKETVRLRRDGSHMEVSLSTAQICDDGCTVTGNMVIFEEITARKLLEEEVRLAKERAERANRAKSAFLANMSHEIRTPMNGVLGMTELVLGTELTPEQRDCLQMAHGSARSLLDLLNDILDFSRLEAGMFTLARVEFDLREVLEGALNAFTVLARRKGVRLTCHVLPRVPAVLIGDPARLRQVITNLLANAVKFTEGGEVSLEVAPEGAGQLRFSVRDTGIGIPHAEQERIFESFVQVDGSLTRRYGGSGLGLTISRDIVRLLGGRIWVESHPGEGSTFHFTAQFTLPEAESSGGSAPPPVLLMDDNPLQEASLASDPSAAYAPPLQGDPPHLPAAGDALKILLVEDEKINQKLARMILESRGHAVTVADHGAEALERLAEARYDLVLMDVQMPVLDGLEATRLIRSETAGRFDPAIPVLAITAHALPDDRDACFAAGMSGYLTKPLDLRQFTAATERLGMRSATAPRPEETSPPAVDAGKVLDLLGGDREGCREVWKAFRNDAPRQLARIAELLESGGVSLARAAHTFKGAAAAVGAEGVHCRASAMEEGARDGDPEELGRLYRKLKDETTRALDAIDRLIDLD